MKLASHQDKLQSLIPEDKARTYDRPDRSRAVIIFTPRSGSSWLSELLANTMVFGNPFEHATHGLLEKAPFMARTECDYLNAFEEHASSGNGVFSIEITWGDIDRFETLDFLAYYQGASFYHLRRRDIVAQAVSLHLATTTGLFHKSETEEIRAEPQISEDTMASIKHWCGHILNYEFLAESHMLCRGIDPMRIIYEDMIKDPSATVAAILERHGITFDGTPTSNLVRISSEKNEALCREFRHSEPGFIDKLTQLRPPI